MEGRHAQIWEAQSRASVYDNDEPFQAPWMLPPHASTTSIFQVNGFPSLSTPEQGAEDKISAVYKSHSQAEKRRRDRINAQLGILRKLIPKSEKMDKAALLGSAIDHVKDLKRKAMEVGKVFKIPTEIDEVIVDSDVSQHLNSTNISKSVKGNKFIRASVCCDDRPELFPELIRVLKGLRLSIVRADIATVGGRVKGVLILENNFSKEDVGVSVLGMLKQSLNVIVTRIASSSMPTNHRIRNFLDFTYSH